MLDCPACIHRCMRIVFADALTTYHPPARPRLLPLHRQLYRQRGFRGLATEASQTLELDDSPLLATPDGNSAQHGQRRPARPRNNTQITEAPHRALLDRELEWIQDPLKLADRVVNLLKRKDDTNYEKGLALVQRASRSMPCTVSWNHLIDYEMGQGRVKHAVKLYNDMKKRAQIPDAHTFTTLFRGFSWNAQHSLTLERTLSIYHSMFADNSPVKPSLTHTNAVLNVCARSGNMDALFGVAARLPTTGRAAPDKLTFTIILNAIKNFAVEGAKGEHGSDSLKERQNRAILQGRKIWGEVRDRWSKGDLAMDEELVCAMGRLLLIGYTDRDYDDVLSLLEQTMDIPRQLPPLGDPARTRSTRREQQVAEASDGDANSLAIENRNQVLAPPDPEEDAEATDIFSNPLSRFLPERYRVDPGPNTLSLAVEACTKLRNSGAAQDYWGLLTSPKHHNIVPDQENYHVYLRLLRLQRASRLALEIVEEMRAGELDSPPPTIVRDRKILRSRISLERKTFRIALSTCNRDMKNKNALGYAQKLVRMMTNTLETPDPTCLISFLDTALGHEPRDWRLLMEIARSQAVNVRTIQSLSAFGFAWTKHKNWKDLQKQEDEVLELVKKLVGVFDVVLNEGRESMEQADKVVCRDTRSSLIAFVTRRMNKREGVAGKIVRRVGREGKEKDKKRGERVKGMIEEAKRVGVEGGGKGVRRLSLFDRE